MSGRAVAVVSGKGGVGKSMLTAALGAALALRGRRVALVDVNTGMRGLDMFLNLQDRVAFDLGDVLEKVCDLSTALVTDRRTGVRLLAARQVCDSEALDTEAFEAVVKALCAENDLVLLDAATGMGRGFTAAAVAAGEALLVTTPDDLSLRDAEHTADLLRRLSLPPPSLVVNRIRADLVDASLQYTPETCAQVLDVKLLGVVPDDNAALRMALSKQPVSGFSPAAGAIENLLDRLLDGEVPLRPWREAAAEKGPGLWARLTRRQARTEGRGAAGDAR